MPTRAITFDCYWTGSRLRTKYVVFCGGYNASTLLSKSTEEYLYMLTLSNRITQYDSWPCLSNYNQTTPSRWFPLPVYRNHTKITCIQRRCSPSRFPVFRTWVFSVNRKSTEYHPSSTDNTQKGYQKSYISIGERIAKKKFQLMQCDCSNNCWLKDDIF